MTARRRALWLFASLLAPLALVGCNAGPDFAPPDPQLPAQSFGAGAGPCCRGDERPRLRPIRTGGAASAIRS